MKRIIASLLAVTALFLTGCLETTQEITLNSDGTGTVANTSDMSALISMAKQMGGAEEIGKAPQEAMDSVISLEEGADSIPNLSPEERIMTRKGALHFSMDLKQDKMVTKLSFPFSNPSEIGSYNTLSGKIIAETLKEQMGGKGAGATPMGDIPEASSFDDYYTLNYQNGQLIKSLNKEKFAGAESDEYFKAMQQASGMGLVMKSNYIINLPRPAKSAEGKGVKLSTDKMKVTITATIDDFLADPSLLEFSIKY